MKTKLLQRRDSEHPLSIAEFDENYSTIEKSLFAIAEFLDLFSVEAFDSYPQKRGTSDEHYTKFKLSQPRILDTIGLSKFFRVDKENKIIYLKKGNTLEELDLLQYFTFKENGDQIELTGLNTKNIISNSDLKDYFNVTDEGKLTFNNPKNILKELGAASEKDVKSIIQTIKKRNDLPNIFSDGCLLYINSDKKLVVGVVGLDEEAIDDDFKEYFGEDYDNVEEAYIKINTKVELFIANGVNIPIIADLTILYTSVKDSDNNFAAINCDDCIYFETKISAFNRIEFEVSANDDGINLIADFDKNIDDSDNLYKYTTINKFDVTSEIIGFKYYDKEEDS